MTNEANNEALADAATDADQHAAPAAENSALVRERRVDAATIAVVEGEVVTELPKDLYIPPAALEVFLETFEGPLDLLLYLIRRQNLDILEIRVAEITEQYMTYIELMNALRLELAGEYLVMAAMLAEIKSRMLLPRPASVVDDEEDPRAELIRRLQEYERFKSAAESIDELPRQDRDFQLARAERPELVREVAHPDVELKDLLLALSGVLKRAELYREHEVAFEPLTVRERMTGVLARIRENTEFLDFVHLFEPAEGRLGCVVTFLAILELVREQLLELVQNEPFAPIYVRAAGADTGPAPAGPVYSKAESEGPAAPDEVEP